MSAIQTYSAAPRSARGSIAIRHLRKSGQVPVNISRKGADSTLVQMDARSAELFDARVVHLAKLTVDGKEITVLRGAIDKNVLNDRITHIDLIEVDENTEVKVQVALVPNTLGCPGVKAGGIVEQSLRSVQVQCKAGSIPDKIEVDLSGAGLMETVYADRLQAPQGVKILTRSRQVVLSISIPRGMSAAKTDAAAATAAGAAPVAAASAPAAGKDAKPAAAAAKPAAKKK